MRARLPVMFVGALVMVLTSLLSPAAFAYPRGDEADPNEGEPKHEINELQNKLHHTDDPSKENHLEGKIDALQAPPFGAYSDTLLILVGGFS